MIDLLKKLISMESCTIEGANDAVDYCGEWLRQHGLPVSLFENNGCRMLVSEIGEGDYTLVLNGHVDVVAGKPEQFKPFEAEGRLYGRGAADMKAGVAAMMAALAELKDKKLGIKVQLQIVSDEEVGGKNCTGFLVEKGYKGDFAICAEPTGLGIANQAKGVLRADVTVSGKPAHGSRPWEGSNAIVKAFEVYKEILDLPFAKESSEYYKFPSINLARIHAGDAYNVVPDKCTMGFDIRYLPGQDKDEILRQIEGIEGIRVLPGFYANPVSTERNHGFLAFIGEIVGKHARKDAAFFGQHGSADTVYFAKQGIPAIEFGPSGAHWHGDNEYVIIDSVTTYKNMLVDLAASEKAAELLAGDGR